MKTTTRPAGRLLFLSVQGGSGRAAESAAREARDPAYKARMLRARQALADEMYDGRNCLAALRLRKGLSQVQLSQLTQLSQPYIAKVEAGRGGELQFSTVIKLAKALDVTTDDLRPLVETLKPPIQVAFS